MFYPLLTAIVMLGVGIGALRLNFRRPINQAVATVCFLSVLIFSAQLVAKHQGALYLIDRTSNPLPWIRLKFALIGLLSPLMVWVCYYLVSGRYSSRRNLLIKLSPWIILSGFLFWFPFTTGFKPDDSLPGNVQQGALYYLYFLPMLAGQLAVCVSAIIVAPHLSGVRRLEFRFITIALGYLSLVAVFVETIYATWPDLPGIHPLTRFFSYIVYLVFAVSAWSVTSRRVYHSGQVVLSIMERVIVIGLVGLIAAFLLHVLSRKEESPFVTATIIGAAFLLLGYADDKLRGWLKLKAEQKTAATVAELHQAATAELHPDRLIRRFEPILRSFADCSFVEILTGQGERYAGCTIELPISALRETEFLRDGWASTAALGRMSASTDATSIQRFLTQAKLDVIVAPRWTTREPTLIVGFGARESNLPYTHPEIRLLRELANVAESLFTRAKLSLQAQQAEQLASIGRLGVKVLHELRNPMATLKSFSQLLPEKIDDKAFLGDFAEIVPKEAERVESLAQQLLDLSRPRTYNFLRADLHKIIEETAMMWKPRADEGGIELVTKLNAASPEFSMDADAIRQVLINLLKNASEAVMRRDGHREIEIRTQDEADHVVIEVEDNGPGLPPEIRSRLFEAFTSNGKPSGVGLGLAICHEIVRAHGGVICADVAREQGAAFRVSLPLSAT
jgi:signal transduction histidine kinase